MEYDPVLLSRIQFAFTVSFHIIFPAFTIGLASFLAVLEALWLKTKLPRYQNLYQFWVKIFAVAFGMGVVSGVVLSYEFGTNWSGFSDKVGNVLGPLLGFEVLTAFFLEASFLGIMLFGWKRVSPKMHFASTCIVAIGTIISAFWILSANSWMQTPTAFTISEGNIFHPLDWMDIIFNPSFPYRFMHMITAAYLTTAFVVGAVGAYYLKAGKHIEHAKTMFSMALGMAIFVTPLQILIGDLHGLNTLQYQPAKIAALEGIWETEKGAALKLFGWPDQKAEKTFYALEVPKLGSLVLTHDWEGEIKGLKSWPSDERPYSALLFWTFRIMVGIGFLMLFTGIAGLILYMKKVVFTNRYFLNWCIAMAPSGFIAVLCGWIVTECGRQPYVVYGLLRTTDTVSPVSGQTVLVSLLAFVVVYSFVFGAASYYIWKLIKQGISSTVSEDAYGTHGVKEPPLITDVVEEGGSHA